MTMKRKQRVCNNTNLNIKSAHLPPPSSLSHLSCPDPSTFIVQGTRSGHSDWQRGRYGLLISSVAVPLARRRACESWHTPFPPQHKTLFLCIALWVPGSSAKDKQLTSHLKDGDGEVWSDSDTFS